MLTCMVTVLPADTLVPAPGLWATTVPAGWAELTTTTEDTSPNPVRVVSAVVWLMPMRFGTITPAIVVVVVLDVVVAGGVVVVVVDGGTVVVDREVEDGATPYWLTK